MPDNVFVLTIISLLCGTVVMITTMALIYCYVTNPRRLKNGPGLQEELRGLRDEVSQLRKQNNDVILSLDHTLQRLEQRMEHVENGVLPAVSQTQPEPQRQYVGR